MALGVGCNAELYVLLMHHPFRKVRLPNNATLGAAIIMNLSTITLLHYHVWDKLHQQNRPAAVTLCDAAAIDRHRHMPLVHSVITAASTASQKLG